MNEWELQHCLTQSWRQSSKIMISGLSCRLLCWELMFPSWKINDNRAKWNECSIDFIFLTEDYRIVCFELKNKIKGKKNLLSAFCQISHRSLNFISGFNREKLYKSCIDCRKDAILERSVVNDVFDLDIESIPENPKVISVIGAVDFPDDSNELINHWSSLDHADIVNICNRYKPNREFLRFKELEEKFSDSNIEVLTHQIKDIGSVSDLSTC